VVPGVKQLILKKDFGNSFIGCSIKQITHGAKRNLEVADRIHHLVVLLGDPVRATKILIGKLSDAQLDNDSPTDLVAWDREDEPLVEACMNVVDKKGKVV
jgi:hypothetical protein